MRRFVVRQKAKEDLQEVWLYSVNLWGLEQADSCISQLIDRFEWLAANPLLGKPRSDVHPDYYCYPEGKHHIFYVIDQHQIDIIGLPHQEMDVIKYF